jgi:hypothetical protein
VTRRASTVRRSRFPSRFLTACLLVTGCVQGQVDRPPPAERAIEPPLLIPALQTVDPCVNVDPGAGGGQAVDAGAVAVDAAAGQGQGQGAVVFPPLLDVRFFQLDVAAAGGPGNSGAIFTLVNAVAKNAVDDLQRFVDVSQVTFDVDAQGRQVERRTALGFESRQTFDKGVQYAVAFLNGQKKLQFTRNHNTGAFEGIIVAPSFDNNAPIASIITPNADRTLTHLIVEDIGNNLKNDYRGELIVDGTLAPLRFSFFQQFNGGLAAQPESAALVKKLAFGGIAGF